MDNIIKTNKKVLLGICLSVLLLLGFRGNIFPHLSETAFFLINRFYYWLVLLIMLLYARKVEQQKLLLYQEQRYSFWKAAGLGLLVFVAASAFGFIVKTAFAKTGLSTNTAVSDFLPALFQSNILYYFLTVITAGVTEELLIRGYLQPRFGKIFNSSFAGITCSAVIFGLLHLGHGTFYYVVNTFFIGLVFAFFYHKYKNIKILIIVHTVWDCLGLLKFL